MGEWSEMYQSAVLLVLLDKKVEGWRGYIGEVG
jgi:hypothetical protein